MVKLTIFGAVFAIGLVVCFGLYLFLKGAGNVKRSLASTAWPKTPGLVIGSSSAQQTDHDAETGAASVTYSTETTLRYSVNGQDYTTNVIHFGQTLGSGDASEAALQRIRYPAGAAVGVSYDPRQPWVAAINPGLHAEAFWLPGAGLAFLLPAVMALLFIPAMYRSMAGTTGEEKAFQAAVHSAIEGAQKGVAPPDIFPARLPRARGDLVMATVAGGLAFICCTLGILALTSGLQRIWRGHASQSWPTADGVVVFAKVGASEVSSGPDHETSTSYSPQFVYQYDVAGTRHYNNVRRFGRIEGAGEDWAEEIASRYRTGARIKVAYYPRDPDVAVLEPGNTNEALWLPGIGLAALLFGLAAFIFIVPAVAKNP